MRAERIALVDLLDRLLAGGIVIAGDLTISIADVDLVRISLRAIIGSIRPEITRIAGHDQPPPPDKALPPPLERPIQAAASRDMSRGGRAR